MKNPMRSIISGENIGPYMLIAFWCIMAVSIAFIASHQGEEAPCSNFREFAISRVPARCFAYFRINSPQ